MDVTASDGAHEQPQPKGEAAPHVVPLILLAAAAVPMMCAWSSWASNHGLIATASAFAMSAIAVLALITTPIAQDVTSADEAQLEEAEAASSLHGTDGEPFGEPNAGCIAGAISATNFPVPAAYAPPKYLNAIAMVVYNIPIIPKSENGAKELRSFNKQSGRRMKIVVARRTKFLEKLNPAELRRALNVSARIML